MALSSPGSEIADRPYHVVGVFARRDDAVEAFHALGETGFNKNERSLIGRQEPGDFPDTLELRPHFDPAELSAQEALRMANDDAKDGLMGIAAGTALGLIAGAVALAVPGVGPAIGIGIWGYVLGGAAAGAATGVVAGGLSHRWEIRYRDLVRQDRVLVGVHVAEAPRATQAAVVLRTFDPEDVEVFDNQGKLRNPV
ncbi:MAG: hypothetical protein M3083_13620 [Actinomycetota bacterium]|nr:hypothetical protein [Actinomycetota bacterium]